MSFGISVVAGGRFDPPFMPTKTKPYIKGLELHIPGIVTDVSETLLVPYDTELVSVAVGSSLYQPTDRWSLYIGADPIPVCDTIFTKDVPEGMYLIAIIPIPANTPIRFKFQNYGGQEKYVWVNYQFLR